jgi:DNA-binding GntR family transcriptional regulator
VTDTEFSVLETDVAVARATAAHRAYAHVKHLILVNQLTPGSELREAQLTETSGYGRTPIREALRRLVQEGFVEVRPRQGYRVAPVTLSRVRELFEMRMLLEPVAAELAASRASQQDLEDLASLGRQTYPPSDPAGYERFLADNCEFHARVAEAAGNSLLARALRTLLEEMQRLFFISLGPAATEQLHEHHELYDALLARDPARARAIVEAQIKSSRQRVLQALMAGERSSSGPISVAVHTPRSPA